MEWQEPALLGATDMKACIELPLMSTTKVLCMCVVCVWGGGACLPRCQLMSCGCCKLAGHPLCRASHSFGVPLQRALLNLLPKLPG